MKNQRGFTLIELVVVIIILGVLSAVAVPKFNDMSTNARNASAKGVAGSLATATSLNYAALQLATPGAVQINQANVCAQAATLTQLVSGITLVNVAPTKDTEFRLTTSATAGANRDCRAATNLSSATCAITAYGTGATPQDVVITCAR